MKFIVSSSILLKQLSAINGVVATNPIVPILEKFLFRLENKKIHVQVDEIKPIKVEGTVTAVITLNSISTDKDEVDEIILEIYKDNNKLFNIHHYDFERITRRLFVSLGYDVMPTKKTRDGGYDMVLRTNGPIPTTHLVECKSSNRGKLIGIREARALYSVVNEHNACSGVLVTNTHFTSGVLRYAEKFLSRIVLLDKYQVLKYITTYTNRFLFPHLNSAL